MKLPELIVLYTDSPMGPYSWLDDRRTVWMPEYYGLQRIRNTTEMEKA